ncbi:endonuclease III [Enterococcus columbae DSM 7374 = ATCC 51263]|uniref:Endonuclease III n=1 Tax=Enterococcus columbae DSM 7374 = ATCC 51263 TaxID=1121865 RepID=S0KYU2_9ENTE|nr:endonuclease III [Enterococcus columbae DSM 7374 = ATCC 51263]EOW84589.1 endonuclease III [Enterococcus columbae DSM 7374 = ATCC 51263]OJG20849.1 endonuclease III [Enterococcus columbae DSM 7374 = ATCC 51263]
MLYRNKAKNIKACAQMLLAKYQGEVPRDKALLVELPGVGRKTANVVAGEAFGIPAIAVDTHVERVTKRLNIVPADASVTKVEEILMKKIEASKWVQSHHTLIFFGRYHCTARSPKCDQCPVLTYCKEGKARLNLH